MTRDPHDVVKLYSGPLEIVEAHQAALSVEGITSNVVGTELSIGLGAILPASTELWVHSADFDRAEAILEKIEKPHREAAHAHETAEKPHREPSHFPHPTDSPKPGHAPARHEPWINPDPHG